ncbi:MAG: hypothetical protein HC923_13335 [Myxococcales bacterium]|nr:hypothetical protein [Myxococcales bacterium]
MERQRPDTTTHEIELYIRTYYSLLRSTGEVRVRSFEEAHSYSDSSLHPGALLGELDPGAFGYAAKRLPAVMRDTSLVVLGQSEEQFSAFGYEVDGWSRVQSPGRRRPMRWNGSDALAMFIASASDIDDLIPIVTAYQIEWNKLHERLRGLDLSTLEKTPTVDQLATWLGGSQEEAVLLERALEPEVLPTLHAVASRKLDLRVRLLAGSFTQYQRVADRWWRGVEPLYLEPSARPAPIYFVSSNTHSLANLLGGYALAHADQIRQTLEARGDIELTKDLELSAEKDDEVAQANLLYFALREHVRHVASAKASVQAWDVESGIRTVPDPDHVEVTAQVIRMSALRPERFDPRLEMEGLEWLVDSEAIIVNIDYPLGMAAYQLLSRVCRGTSELRGVYVMGKAATLNARVGDVMISGVVHDEHSKNTYIFRNAFDAGEVGVHLRYGSVLDNQKALTVRSAFLQNRDYMGVFYREGYTVLEMEAGPYLSAVYESVDPRRHPQDEIVVLGDRVPYELGILHYASDTPYSRRQELLSKSLGYFGMDATYACAAATLRRVLSRELSMMGRG